MDIQAGADRPDRQSDPAHFRDVEQDARGRQQDQRDQEQDRRDVSAQQREQDQDARDLRADQRQARMDLYRDAVQAGPGGAGQVSLWQRADTRALLARRHDAVLRDGSSVDRHDDDDHREDHRVEREQAEINRQVQSAQQQSPHR